MARPSSDPFSSHSHPSRASAARALLGAAILLLLVVAALSIVAGALPPRASPATEGTRPLVLVPLPRQ